MSGQIGFWDVQDRLSQLSRHGDSLEKLSVTVDFEIFRANLAKAAPRGDRSKGGRLPFDPISKFKMLVLQALNGLAIVPDHFEKIAASPAKAEQMAAQGIASEHLLDLESQPGGALLMSVCPVAKHTWTPAGIAIIASLSEWRRPAPAASRAETASAHRSAVPPPSRSRHPARRKREAPR